MANYAVLKAAINAVIKTNGNKEITGQVLNQTLMAIVDSLGENYQFAGVAVPSTNPGTPDQNIFYLATQAGTYTNFGATVLPAGISMLEWKNNTWSSETFFTIDDAPTAGSDHLVKSGGVKTAIDNIAFSTNEKVKDVGIDSTPTSGSDNLIKSGAVFDAFKNDGGAYDVSVHFPTGGVEGGNTYTLDGAIAMVPQNMRKGGMSIKFVSSSDNKYVQARCMADEFTTDISAWQGVDAEPTAGSKNLVESNGVGLSIRELKDDIYGPLSVDFWFTSNGGLVTTNASGFVIVITPSDTVSIKAKSNGVRYAYITSIISPSLVSGTTVGSIDSNATATITSPNKQCLLWISDAYSGISYAPESIVKNDKDVVREAIEAEITNIKNNLSFTGNYTPLTRNSILTSGIYKSTNYVLVVYIDNDIVTQLEFGGYLLNGTFQFVYRQRKYIDNSWSNWTDKFEDISGNISTLYNSIGQLETIVNSFNRKINLISDTKYPINVAPICKRWFGGTGREFLDNISSTGYIIAYKAGDSITIKAGSNSVRYVQLATEYAESGTVGSVSANNSVQLSELSSDGYLWVSNQYVATTTENWTPISIIKNGAELLGTDVPSSVFVEYNSSTKRFSVYHRINSTNKFVKYIIGLRDDTSEVVYQYVWSLIGGSICSYVNGSFIELISNTMAAAENEFAFKYANTADYTGGYHGDERIDIDSSSYVKFLIDGSPLNNNSLGSDFSLWCNDFSYIEYSTLHKTIESGTSEPIEGHPIIAYHFKETKIESTLKIKNIVRFVDSLSIIDYFSGLFCLGKNFATTSIISGQEFDTSGGSNVTFTGDDVRASEVIFYNNTNKVGAIINSELVRKNFNADLPGRLSIWDRSTDTKYYRYLVVEGITSALNVSSGNIIETETVVEYNA